ICEARSRTPACPRRKRSVGNELCRSVGSKLPKQPPPELAAIPYSDALRAANETITRTHREEPICMSRQGFLRARGVSRVSRNSFPKTSAAFFTKARRRGLSSMHGTVLAADCCVAPNDIAQIEGDVASAIGARRQRGRASSPTRRSRERESADQFRRRCLAKLCSPLRR